MAIRVIRDNPCAVPIRVPILGFRLGLFLSSSELSA